MIRDEVRAYFAELPGMHGLVQAALSGWHGRVMPLRNGAVIAVGDFLICGGEPGREGREALETALLSQPRDWLIYAPGPWLDGLNRRGGFQPVKRRGFQPLQPGCRRESPCAKALPSGYTIGIMDAADARECLEAAWSRDFVREHGTAEKFVERGLGVLIRDGDGRPAAGASAYVSWPGGLEVQLQTREDLQRQGLGLAAAARLLEAARERRLTVAWDAANGVSAHMAEKLGFLPGAWYVAWMAAR